MDVSNVSLKGHFTLFFTLEDFYASFRHILSRLHFYQILFYHFDYLASPTCIFLPHLPSVNLGYQNLSSVALTFGLKDFLVLDQHIMILPVQFAFLEYTQYN